MEYSLSIQELINRPIIRSDMPYEFLNKMTNEEIFKWEEEVETTLHEENTPFVYPDWNAAFLAKTIDREVLYDILKKESK